MEGGKLVQNDETGEAGIWDGQTLTKLPGRLVTHESGAKALWDGKTLTPIKVDINPNLPGAAQDQAKVDRVLSPQQVEQKTSPKAYSQPPMQNNAGVFETLNKPIDFVADQAGRAVQQAIGPNEHPTLSDIGGGLTKAAIQYAAPGVALKGLGMAGKLASKFIPGLEGGQMESKIGKAGEALQSGLKNAQSAQAGIERVVNRIPQSATTPLPKTQQVLDQILATDNADKIISPIRADAERIKGLIAEGGGTRNLQAIDRELTRMGEKTKTILGQEPADPRYKQIFGAMAQDLENQRPVFRELNTDKMNVSPTNAPEFSSTGYGTTIQPSPQAPLIRVKDQAIRRTKGYEDLIDEFNNLTKTKRGMAGQQDINANQLMDKLKKNEALRDSLTPEDWQKIDPILRDLADMKVLPSPKGANYGSGRSLVLGSAGALAGKALGLDPYITGAATTVISNGVGRLLMTEGGRNMVKAILKVTEYSPTQKINALNGIARLSEKGISDAQKASQ